MLAEMSSRMAACGQPPVSIARIRDAGRALFRMRNSWSSRVKMSFVTVARVGAAFARREEGQLVKGRTDVIFLAQLLAECECECSLS